MLLYLWFVCFLMCAVGLSWVNVVFGECCVYKNHLLFQANDLRLYSDLMWVPSWVKWFICRHPCIIGAASYALNERLLSPEIIQFTNKALILFFMAQNQNSNGTKERAFGVWSFLWFDEHKEYGRQKVMVLTLSRFQSVYNRQTEKQIKPFDSSLSVRLCHLKHTFLS